MTKVLKSEKDPTKWAAHKDFRPLMFWHWRPSMPHDRWKMDGRGYKLEIVALKTVSDECETAQQDVVGPIKQKFCQPNGVLKMSDAQFLEACAAESDKDACATASCDHQPAEVLGKIFSANLIDYSRDSWTFIRNLRITAGDMQWLVAQAQLKFKEAFMSGDMMPDPHIIMRGLICDWVTTKKDIWESWLPFGKNADSFYEVGCRKEQHGDAKLCGGSGECVKPADSKSGVGTCKCASGFFGPFCESKTAVAALGVVADATQAAGTFVTDTFDLKNPPMVKKELPVAGSGLDFKVCGYTLTTFSATAQSAFAGAVASVLGLGAAKDVQVKSVKNLAATWPAATSGVGGSGGGMVLGGSSATWSPGGGGGAGGAGSAGGTGSGGSGGSGGKRRRLLAAVEKLMGGSSMLEALGGRAALLAEAKAEAGAESCVSVHTDVDGIEVEAATMALNKMSDEGTLTVTIRQNPAAGGALGAAKLVVLLRELADVAGGAAGGVAGGAEKEKATSSVNTNSSSSSSSSSSGACIDDSACPAASPLCVQLGGGGGKCMCASKEAGAGATKCGGKHKWWTYQDRENSFGADHPVNSHKADKHTMHDEILYTSKDYFVHTIEKGDTLYNLAEYW